MPLRHLAGQVRAGEHAGGDAREHLGHHLGHAQVGPHLDPLGQAHDGLDLRPPAAARRSSTARNPCEGTAMKTMRDALERLGERRRHRQPVGERDAREVRLVLARLRHGRGELGRARPERRRDARHRRWSPPPCPRTRHRSPPPGRSCTRDYGGPATAFAFDPYTVPVSRATVPAARARGGAGRRPPGARGRPDPGQGLPPGQAAARVRPGRSRPRSARAGHGHTRGGGLRAAARRRGLRRRGAWPTGRRSSAPPSCGSPDRVSTVPCGPASTAWPGPGRAWVTVAHGDLPRARGLGALAPFDGVTLVPDRRDDGTNVLRLPAGSRLPLRLRPRLLPGPPGRSDAARPRRARPAGPGPGLRRRLARRRRRARPRRPDRTPDAEPGARRPPVSRVPEGTQRLAPLRRLAGRRPPLDGLLAPEPASWPPSSPEPASWRPCAGALGRLLRRSPLLGGLASRSPLLGGLAHGALGRLLRRSPLLGGLACRSPLGRLLGRSPLLRSLACRSPLHGLPCRSPLDGLLGRSCA